MIRRKKMIQEAKKDWKKIHWLSLSKCVQRAIYVWIAIIGIATCFALIQISVQQAIYLLHQ